MKLFSMLHSLYLSFFSPDLYRDVRTNWKGTGFLYLLLLLSLTWLPVMTKVHWVLSDAVRQDAPKYIAQVPKLAIQHGEVSIDRPVPFAIVVPDSGTPLLVIDTSGSITSFEQTPALALLTRNKFMYRKTDGNETRIYDLSKIDDFTLDRDRVNGWVQAFRKYFATLAYPVVLVSSFTYRVLQMLLYAAIGMLFVKMLKAPLDYLTLLRLASVSITPVIVLSTLQVLTGIHIPAFWLICFVIAMGYLFFAIKSNIEPVPPEAPVLEA
jgi:hypothetical protein